MLQVNRPGARILPLERAVIKEPAHNLRVGKAVGGGGFILDEKMAREKLQDFQLPSRHHYLLEFVKAAHLLGAETIEFGIGVNEVVAIFDGEALRSFEDLYSAPFSHRTDDRRRALRHLAIGASSARGLGLREFTIEVAGENPHGVCIVGGEISELEVEPEGDVPWVTRIYLRRRVQWRTVSRFIERVGGIQGEVDLLKERCRFCRRTLLVNGEVISDGLELPHGTYGAVTFEGPTESGVLGVRDRGQKLHTHVMQHGVLIDTDAQPTRFWPATAIVDSSRLTTNLSQSAFVEDEAWHELHDLLEEATLESWLLYRDRLDYLTLLQQLREINAYTDFDSRMEKFLSAVPEDERLQTELERIELIRENIGRWEASPQSLTPDEAIYPFHKTSVREEGWRVSGLDRVESRPFGVGAAIALDDRPSEILLIKDGHLLQRIELHNTGLTGLSLRIDGPLPVTDDFKCDLRARQVESGLTEATKVLVKLVDDSLHQLPEAWLFIFVEELLSATLHVSLCDAIERTTSAMLGEYLPGPRAIQSHDPGSRLQLLGAAANLELFEDIRGASWSLRQLWEHAKREGLDVVAAGVSKNDKLLDDPLLKGHPIFFFDKRLTTLVYPALDLRTTPLDRYRKAILRNLTSTERETLREKETQETIRQQIDRWKATPASVLPDEGYLHLATNTLDDGSTIAAALFPFEEPFEEPSELLFIKDDHLLQRRALKDTALPGLSLRIEVGTTSARIFFEGSHHLVHSERMLRSRLKPGLLALVRLLVELLDELLPTMDTQWQLAFMEAIVSGDLQNALREAFQWNHWPRELQNDIPPKSQLGLNRPRRLRALLSAQDVEIFEDIHGNLHSLSGLWANHFRLWNQGHLSELEIFCVANSECDVPLDDRRLQSHIVLVDEPRRISIIESVLNLSPLPVADYLERIEGEPELARVTFSNHTEKLIEQAREIRQTSARTPVVDEAEEVVVKQKPGKEPVRKVSVRKEPAARTLTPGEEKFLRQLREEIQLPNELIETVDLVDGEPSAPLLSEESKLVMNRNHVAIRYALEFPKDPMARGFVVLAIHGRHRPDSITDHSPISRTQSPTTFQ